MSNPVLCAVADGIATLTLNGPDKLNAINYATADAPLTALNAIEAGAGVRAVILTGAGERAWRIPHHSPLAVAAIIRAVTRGLNMTIGEGLQVESEQFARLAPTHDLRERLDAWMARRPDRGSEP